MSTATPAPTTVTVTVTTPSTPVPPAVAPVNPPSTPAKQSSFFNEYGKPFIVGSLSGSVASAVIQPIDTTKVVIQSRREAAGRGAAVTNPFTVAKEIVSQNGVVGLYKGLDSAILRQFIYAGIRLGLYKSLEDRVKLN